MKKTITVDFTERDGVTPVRARFPRCCDEPLPRVGIPLGGRGPAYTADLYCWNCQATYGIITWEK